MVVSAEKAMDIAKYFMAKDTDGQVFCKDLMTGRNNRTFYVGNAKLNKFLHLAQNVYLAKYGRKLFEDDLVAYDNGAVVPAVLKKFAVLVSGDKEKPQLPEATAKFLDVFYEAFKNADIDELIDLSHDDLAWQEKSGRYYSGDEIMEIEKHLDFYRMQYADMIKVMDRMAVNA